MKKLYFLLIFALLFGGCLQPITPEQQISSSSYPSITKHFLDQNITTKSSYYNNRIIFDEFMSDIFGGASLNISGAVNHYLSNYDSSNDKIAKAFIAHAKAKNHDVKMYKTTLNQTMAGYLPMISEIKSMYKSLANLDNAFVEFDENNRILSVLVRVHYYSDVFGINDHLVSFIAFGELARYIENNVQNYLFEDSFITKF
ncbi:hypothetical protein [Campylobacter mucosalis]|uniref:hypothetical protein n=1 Tax=Campylobacter mucosalis TaxID=202 RepID=UPI0004D939FC|nr:hypothetical protein [Campylobacter mucosalis]KEA46682.1 hypothetical protein CR66_02390 [Campylobacter mucosalis]QKF62792.1 hypothetical protein CMCT_0644 [Campylobacter mucosalis]